MKENYSLIEKIGEGNYGEVYSGTLQIAIKRIPKKIIKKQNLYQELEREREILSKCNSQNIIKLYDFIENDNYYDFLLEKCDTDLSELLNNKKQNFTLSEIRNIMNQLNNAFKELEKNNIIHRDIKLENILVKYINKSQKDFIVKLGDFGLSREINIDINDSFAGSIETMAPEILSEKPYNNKVDLWSIGIIMYQMYYNILPEFDNNNLIVKLPDDHNFRNLLEMLLKKNPDERINWDDYFNHPFFNDVKFINILVIGKENVGKSTLIKNVLKDKNENNENIENKEMNIIDNSNYCVYENKNKKFRFYEMKGYNETIYDFEYLFKDMNTLIENQLLKKSIDKYVNCIWYCFQYEKYNEEEQKYIEQLKKYFNEGERKIPIFFISTKTKDKLLINEIFKKMINNNNNNYRKRRYNEEEENNYVRCRVLCEPIDIINEEGKLIKIIDPFGVQFLIRKTIEKIRDESKEKKNDWFNFKFCKNKIIPSFL